MDGAVAALLAAVANISSPSSSSSSLVPRPLGGYIWGVLSVSLRASGTQRGLDMTCFVIRHPSSLEKGLKNWKKKFEKMENVEKIGNSLKK